MPKVITVRITASRAKPFITNLLLDVDKYKNFEIDPIARRKDKVDAKLKKISVL